MKIHIASETEYMIQGNGVHTAYVDHVELMRSKDDVEVVVNNEGRGDVFHCHTYGPYYFWKGLPYKGRRIHTVHVIPESIVGSLPMWKLFMPFVKWYFKQVYSFADVCIAISPRVEQAIIETGAKTEIVRIYNPIPSDKWKCSDEKRALGRKMLGLRDDEFVVLGVGQLQARKGVEDFISVAEEVPEARFVWVGGRPFKAMTEGIARIDKRIANGPENILFPGMLHLDLMPLVYAAADMLLFPSYQENCPLAPIEAASCGLPVVFRDLKEYRMLYEYPYLNGITICDYVAITRRLMKDKQFYSNSSLVSANMVKQFDKEMVRNQMLNLYNDLSNRVIDALPFGL